MQVTNANKPRRKRGTAHHEAAHAVLARDFGAAIDCIFLDKEGGQCDFVAPSHWTNEVDAIVLLAGPIASQRILKKLAVVVVGCSQDYEIAWGLLPDSREFGSAMNRAHALVQERWAGIGRVARVLLASDCGHMTGEEIEAALALP